MAKAYRAIHDVSIPRVITRISGEGDDAQYETTGENYPAGSFVKSEDMTPRDQKRAEDGDLEHVLEPLSDEEAEHIEGWGDHNSTVGIFIPEHEAERHVLEEAGHVTVSREQELDLMSQGASFAAEYQGAVNEHGLDRRPVQEHNAKPRPRIPDEILTGGETRTGLPHNPNPEDGTQEGSDDEEQGQQEENAGSQPRPRPGQSGYQTTGDAESEKQPEENPYGGTE